MAIPPVIPASARSARYQVPRQLTLASMLGITTLFAIVFGVLRWLEALPPLFMFFGTLGFIVSVVQMVYGADPRAASIFAGAGFLPLWLVLYGLLGSGRRGMSVLEWMFAMPCSVVAGAFLGYLTGALAAGVFLILDEVERYRRRRSASK